MIVNFLLLVLLLVGDPPSTRYKDLNVTYRMRGYCYAESSIVDTIAPGGFGGSDNAAKNSKPTFSSITGTLFLLDTSEQAVFQNFEEPVETKKTKALRSRFESLSQQDPKYKLLRDSLIDLLYEKYNGHNLYLINNSNSVISFAASDSRLDIVAEVKVDTGWAAIEYNPSSWCGNSYHTV